MRASGAARQQDKERRGSFTRGLEVMGRGNKRPLSYLKDMAKLEDMESFLRNKYLFYSQPSKLADVTCLEWFEVRDAVKLEIALARMALSPVSNGGSIIQLGVWSITGLLLVVSTWSVCGCLG